MDMLERNDLKELIGERDLCVSIFMPTHRMGAETRQDPIRLKNALAEAENKLRDLGLRAPEAKAFLKPVYRLLDSPVFWRYQGDGLAIFRSPKVFRSYRLPAAFDELLVVTRRFHVKPLLPLLAADGLFYILALSQKEVRLLQGSGHSVRSIDLEEMPKGLSDALKYDVYEQSLQFHTQTAAPAASGRRAAMFHGQGGGADDAKDRILIYFQQIDQALRELLRDEQAPLVLAGVEYLIPLYLKASTYSHTLGEGITGNPEGLPNEELHARAWKIVGPAFLKSQRKDFSRYLDLSGGPRASKDIRVVLPAAREGRVEILFVTEGVRQWGTLSLEGGEIVLADGPEAGMEDLLDLAAVQTLLHGGTVHVLTSEKMQEHGPVAAVFRY
jgi:hypothetical protein